MLIGSTFQSEKIKKSIQLLLGDRPIILENGVIDLPNVYSVVADEEHGVAACLELLFTKGRKHPCYINMNTTPSNLLKLRGFSHVWKEHFPGTEPHVIDIPRRDDCDEWKACYEAVKELFSEEQEIDSLIFSTDQLANAGMRALQDRGIRIPEDVAIIGIDNSIYSQLCSPQMTVLNNKMPELSITCSNVLLQILGGQTVSNRLMVVSEIIERGTT